MASRRQIQAKGQSNSTPTPVTGMFQPRAFGMLAKSEAATAPELQTKAELGRVGGDRLSRIDFSAPPPIQPKLTIGVPGDKYEQAADATARQIIQQQGVGVSNLQAKQAEINPTPLGETACEPIQGNVLDPTLGRSSQSSHPLVIQTKLWSRKQFQQNTNAGLLARRKNPHILEMDKGLKEYESLTNSTQKKQVLLEIKKAIDAFLDEKQESDTSVRRKGVKELQVMVMDELAQLSGQQSIFEVPTGSSSNPYAIPDQPIPENLKNQSPTSGKLKIFVHREQEWLINTIKECEIGHAWVKLISYVNEDRQGSYTYGFWPQKSFSLTNSVPGYVANPDRVHEEKMSSSDGSEFQCLEYSLSLEKFNKAFLKAQRLAASAPDYNIYHYNCTTFTREIAQEAGVSFPGKPIIPTGVLYNPNWLYSGIEAENKQRQKSQKEPDSENSTPNIDSSEIAQNGQKYLVQNALVTHPLTRKHHKLTGYAILEALNPELDGNQDKTQVPIRIKAYPNFRDLTNHQIPLKCLNEGIELQELAGDGKYTGRNIIDKEYDITAKKGQITVCKKYFATIKEEGVPLYKEKEDILQPNSGSLTLLKKDTPLISLQQRGSVEDSKTTPPPTYTMFKVCADEGGKKEKIGWVNKEQLNNKGLKKRMEN